MTQETANPRRFGLAVIARVAARLRAWRAARARRRAVDELLRLDERYLRDIGLTRLDVEFARRAPDKARPAPPPQRARARWTEGYSGAPQ